MSILPVKGSDMSMIYTCNAAPKLAPYASNDLPSALARLQWLQPYPGRQQAKARPTNLQTLLVTGQVTRRSKQHMAEPQLRARMGAARNISLPMPKKYLPNWAVAGILTAFVGATYYSSMHAVGTDDMTQELQREAVRQDAAEEAQ